MKLFHEDIRTIQLPKSGIEVQCCHSRMHKFHTYLRETPAVFDNTDGMPGISSLAATGLSTIFTHIPGQGKISAEELLDAIHKDYVLWFLHGSRSISLRDIESAL